MRSGIPNLFIIGAMKSGTSSLHAYLNEHPDIFMCPRKEPTFFVESDQLRKIWPDLERKKLWSDEARYLSLFADVRNEKIVGESSTGYTKLNKIGGVAERIFKFNPESRFIYLMRDPVERTISHYWHAVANDGEHRRLLKAVTSEPHYIEVSDYALQLRPYLDLFGRDRIMAITMEELMRSLPETVSAIFEWLGVDAKYVPGNLGRIENAAPVAFKKAAGFGMLYRIRNSRAYELLEGAIPKKAKRWAVTRMTSTATRNNEENDACVEYLRPILQGKTHALEDLLQREFSEWTTLWGRI